MKIKTKVNLLGFLTVLFWAMAFPFSKIAISHFHTNSLAILRCGIASIFLCTLAIYKKIPFPKKQDIPKFFISGLFGFFYILFFLI